MFKAHSVIKELQSLGTLEKAKAFSWFFKTEKGQYGHGDIFYGVTVPEQRVIAKRYKDLPLKEIHTLLESKVHECRLTGLLILVGQYTDADRKKKKEIAGFYLAHTKRVNNWDLVDSSASYILGTELLDKNRKILYTLARSSNIWERRIAVIATLAFIKKGQYEDTCKIAGIFLQDKHDLIQKAVGWMLREVGKKSLVAEEVFLKKHAAHMPRTMLRYAVEKFPEKKRKIYLKQTKAS